MPDEYEEMLDKTLAAYEQSTGEAPNDYQFAEIKVVVHDYVEEGRDS